MLSFYAISMKLTQEMPLMDAYAHVLPLLIFYLPILHYHITKGLFSTIKYYSMLKIHELSSYEKTWRDMTF